jgi:hypothetical protein
MYELLCTGLTAQELMQQGRKEIHEIDNTLGRTEKVLEDTIAIGAQVGWPCKPPAGILVALCRAHAAASHHCLAQGVTDRPSETR